MDHGMGGREGGRGNRCDGTVSWYRLAESVCVYTCTCMCVCVLCVSVCLSVSHRSRTGCLPISRCRLLGICCQSVCTRWVPGVQLSCFWSSSGAETPPPACFPPPSSSSSPPRPPLPVRKKRGRGEGRGAAPFQCREMPATSCTFENQTRGLENENPLTALGSGHEFYTEVGRAWGASASATRGTIHVGSMGTYAGARVRNFGTLHRAEKMERVTTALKWRWLLFACFFFWLFTHRMMDRGDAWHGGPSACCLNHSLACGFSHLGQAHRPLLRSHCTGATVDVG